MRFQFMRKLVNWVLLPLAGIAFLLVGMGFVLGYVYGDSIKGRVIAELNKHLNAKITVSNIEFSFLQNFPEASISFHNIRAFPALDIKEGSRSGIGLNSMDTLFYFRKLSILFDIKAIYYKDYSVEKLVADNGVVKLAYDSLGNGNYKLWKEDTTTSSDLRFKLQHLKLLDCRLEYLNLGNRQSAKVNLSQLDFTGQFSGKSSSIAALAKGTVQWYRVDNSKFLENAVMETSLQVRLKDERIQITQAFVNLNKLYCSVGGVFSAGAETAYRFDLQSKSCRIEDMLSLFPLSIRNSLAEYQPTGLCTASATVSSTELSGNPASLKLDINLSKSSFKKPSTKTFIDVEALKATYTSVPKQQDHLQIPSIRGKMNGQPFTASVDLHNTSSPRYDARLKGYFDLGFLKTTLVLNSFKSMSGHAALDVNLHNEGPAAATSLAKGTIAVDKASFVLSDGSWYNGLNGQCQFNGTKINVYDVTGTANWGDFRLSGVLEGWSALSEGKAYNARAAFTMSMKRLNLNEFAGNPKTKSSSLHFDSLLMRLPRGRYAINVGELRYKKAIFREVDGTITKSDGGINAEKITLRGLGGNVQLNGTLLRQPNDSVSGTTSLQLQGIKADQLLDQLDGLGQEVLQARNISGSIDAKIQMSMLLSNSLAIDNKKLKAVADIVIHDGQLKDFAPAMALSRFIKDERLKDIRFSTLSNQFQISNEVISFPEMEIKSSALNLFLAGRQNFDLQMDYKLRMRLAELMGTDRGPKQTRFGEVEEPTNYGAQVFLKLTGTIDSPIVAYDKQAVGEKVKQDLIAEKKTLGNILRQEFSGNNKKLEAKEKPEIREGGPEIADDELDVFESEAKTHETAAERNKNPKPTSERKNAFRNFSKRFNTGGGKE